MIVIVLSPPFVCALSVVCTDLHTILPINLKGVVELSNRRVFRRSSDGLESGYCAQIHKRTIISIFNAKPLLNVRHSARMGIRPHGYNCATVMALYGRLLIAISMLLKCHGNYV